MLLSLLATVLEFLGFLGFLLWSFWSWFMSLQDLFGPFWIFLDHGFWMEKNIRTYNEQCDFDWLWQSRSACLQPGILLGLLHLHVFPEVFSQFFQKYTQVVKKWLTSLSYGSCISYITTATILIAEAFSYFPCGMWTVGSLWVYGVMYLYQCFVTLLYSIK